MPPRRSTRSSSTKEKNESEDQKKEDQKRSASPNTKPASKKAKKEHDGRLEVGAGGEVGLKDESDDKNGQLDNDVEEGEVGVVEAEGEKAKDEADGTVAGDGKEDDPTSTGFPDEKRDPEHGTLESGHIYFLYRPKIDVDEPESIDDISKFHILLIPTSAPYDKSHFHRVIEVGKKKMPDPGAKHQVIWGLVGDRGNDPKSLKDHFGPYTYETKTRGTRHQQAARPAARGHYILHSPQDTLADSPDHNRQRDYKLVLAYELTNPTPEDFGQVQKELGLAHKDAVVLQVKEPSADTRGNPRAAGIPMDKRAHYPPELQDLFHGRRFIPCNPPAYLNYKGTELLIISSPHELHDSLGQGGEKAEKELDHEADVEAVDVDETLKELGMNKKEFPAEALEGHWA